ncbi:MAG TPA: T9SS type A sorting domain-containing protein, partial [Ignavibacteriaceae bacterium]|nr:T9SS type A sorting domain-containing protein [Ignavibacteriaceae bacterium]
AYITLNYGVDDGVTEPVDLRIAKSNGSVWENIGGTANGAPEGSILSSQFTSFSDFVLANAAGGSNPLPVELASFTASSRENDVILQWTTKTEMQNYGFEIEKCVKPDELSDEPNWVSIGFVNGSGNSNSTKEYSFVAKKLFLGSYLFRLKQLDTDGSFMYSSEIEINIGSFPETFRLEQNYPNPFNPATTIKFAVNETNPVSVKVYDALGNEVKTLFNETAENGKLYSVEFDGSDYASGVYYYSISGNNLHAVKKMLLIK